MKKMSMKEFDNLVRVIGMLKMCGGDDSVKNTLKYCLKNIGSKDNTWNEKVISLVSTPLIVFSQWRSIRRLKSYLKLAMFCGVTCPDGKTNCDTCHYKKVCPILKPLSAGCPNCQFADAETEKCLLIKPKTVSDRTFVVGCNLWKLKGEDNE